MKKLNLKSRPDDICEQHAGQNSKITVKMLDNDTVLFEGDAQSLKFMGKLFLAIAQAKDTGFQLSPTGAGKLFFTAESSHGLYIHRLEEQKGDNQHCCKEMEFHLQEGEVALLYLPEFREYGIQILDGGSSFQEIYYCPWCGKKLPSSLRDQWFDRMEELGYEWGDENIPTKYLSDKWWCENPSDNGTGITIKLRGKK